MPDDEASPAPLVVQQDTAIRAIEKLERVRGSKVIVYITGDRLLDFNGLIPPGAPLPASLITQIHPDVLPYFHEALKSIGSTQKITLAIYTNGGLIETPWPLVNLIREYCKEFEVVILQKSLSAGTLVALGADKIIMPTGSHLSPIDPMRMQTGANNLPKPLEIEDILGFIDFAKTKVGINDESALGEVLKELSKEIEPSVIGSINRTHSLVRRLAKMLLGLHNEVIPEHQSIALIEQLTEKLFSHNHLINRREAIQIGFGDLIEKPNAVNERTINALYEIYANKLKLTDPFVPVAIASANSEVVAGEGYKEDCLTAVLQTTDIKFKVEPKVLLQSKPGPNGQQLNINVSNESWKREG